MKLPQFGLHALLLLTLGCACCSGVATWIIAARKSARQQAGLGIQNDTAHWPYVLRNLLKSDERLKEGLTPCGLTAGFDQSSIWRLDSDAPMIELLKFQLGLETATNMHPKAVQLISEVPPGWPTQNWASSVWYATPGFGTRHIEGGDLYLLVVDSNTGAALVLHEFHF